MSGESIHSLRLALNHYKNTGRETSLVLFANIYVVTGAIGILVADRQFIPLVFIDAVRLSWAIGKLEMGILS